MIQQPYRSILYLTLGSAIFFGIVIEASDRLGPPILTETLAKVRLAFFLGILIALLIYELWIKPKIKR